MTARTAQNLMAAAGFVEGKPESVSFLPAAILYKLAAPSAPPDLVQDVVEAATAEAPLDAQTIAGPTAFEPTCLSGNRSQEKPLGTRIREMTCFS